MHLELVTMSTREIDVLDVIRKIHEQRLTQVKAGELLGLSDRQVRRLCVRYERDGAAGLVSRQRGRPSNHRLPDALRDHAVAIVRERYAHFGPQLAHEKLVELHGVRVSKETLRGWLVQAGLWTTPDLGRFGFLAAMAPGHVHLAKVVAGGRAQERVADAQHDTFEIEAHGSTWARAARFTALGIEHIFTGLDHVAFLLGLLLAGGALRDVLRVVSSFTVAHAVTLALAALGIVAPGPSLVEPLIAASVVCVALENLLAARRASGTPRRRWTVAFGFGLVHGFGFAGTLRELRLPAAGLATALFSFNLGIELGQAAIVAAALPFLSALRRRSSIAQVAVPAGSLAVGGAGLIWLVERVTR